MFRKHRNTDRVLVHSGSQCSALVETTEMKRRDETDCFMPLGVGGGGGGGRDVDLRREIAVCNYLARNHRNPQIRDTYKKSDASVFFVGWVG